MRRVVYAAAWLALAAGCLGKDVIEPGSTPVSLVVRADVSAAAVASVVVVVSAPDISPNLVFDIPITGGVASGSITLPAGSNRTITMHAYDAGGIETHRGARTASIRADANPAISLVLAPLAGDVPIEATIGSFLVTVTPALDTLAAGGTAQLSATIVDAGGQPVNAAVVWASLDPGVATVASTGDRTAQVTAAGPGTATVVASYGGSAGAAHIVVPGPPAIRPGVRMIAESLVAPLYLTQPPADTTRLFVVLQPGIIRVLRNDTLLETPFLDIRDRVVWGGERGLLSLAFDPNYATNGRFFVAYSEETADTLLDGDLKVVRFNVSADPNVADPASAQVILSVPHATYARHNGGLVRFGPDGYLYVGFGDGGSDADTTGNGQSKTTLLGKILRLDVRGDGLPYVVPTTNPFYYSPPARPEIWAYGFRNPWRFSFDRVTHDLYIADVGEGAREELDVQPATSTGGENYGWSVMEGTACFRPTTGCNSTGLVLPVMEYNTHVDGACAITGGYVYRGSRLPALVGQYFYGDFCARWVRSFRYVNGVVQERRDWTPEFGLLGRITSFGEDSRGEIYVIVQEGRVYRIVPVTP